MDWSKIKAVLIVVFIIINIALGYSLYSSYKSYDREIPVETEVFENVVKLLSDKNIDVQATVSSYREQLPSMTVEYETYDLEDYASKFLGEKYDVIDGVAISGEKAIKVENRTALKFFHTLVLDEKNDATAESAKVVAERFLTQYGFEFEKEPWRVAQQGEFIAVTYKEFYNGYYLDETYMVLEIYDNEVVRFSRKWFQNVTERDDQNKILPASEALFKVIERAYSESVTYGDRMVIEKMELGYRFDDNILFFNIMSADIYPYWRITFSDGRIIYIGAVNR